jgi:hypothetical protein
VAGRSDEAKKRAEFGERSAACRDKTAIKRGMIKAPQNWRTGLPWKPRTGGIPLNILYKTGVYIGGEYECGLTDKCIDIAFIYGYCAYQR